MLIDHIGVTLNTLDRYYIVGEDIGSYMSDAFWQLRIIGRLAFPIFAFLVAEGCAHTRDIKAYIKRLFIFALLSQVPYQVVINLVIGNQNLLNFSGLNVMITLAFGALAVYFYQFWFKTPSKKILAILGILGSFLAVIILCGEYSYSGILIILLVYMFRPKCELDPDAQIIGARYLQVFMCALSIGFYYQLHFPLFSYETIAAFLVAIPLCLYNGNPGNRKGKLAFYAFYPFHLSLLAIIMYLVMF